jgi:hypothetical protein
MATVTTEDVEHELEKLAEGITASVPGECLFCYLLRTLDAFGCDTTLRWAERWRDQQPATYGWLMPWLRSGGGYCDCEVIFNVFDDDRRSERHRQVRCEASYDDESPARFMET